MKIKVSEAKDQALDWLVAKCEGVETIVLAGLLHSKDVVRSAALLVPVLAYSTDWAQGGPIIEREWIALEFLAGAGDAGMDVWVASIGGIDECGPTPLIAAMRCYVASKLGDEVEIPEELK
jgi:hypothetical protein